MKITFLNVGQGDSIILEWNDKGIDKLALIDSNINERKQNPALDYISQKENFTFEFILLSHPHTDHFSGLYDIINYCKDNSIIINMFLHTCHQLKDYLRSTVKTNSANTELVKLFLFAWELRQKNIIRRYSSIDNEKRDIVLNDDINISILSPSTIEDFKFTSHEPLYNDEEDYDCIPDANWLCTVLRIYSKKDDWSVILTSDSPLKVFTRIRKDNFNTYSGLLVLTQCPHHGSKKCLNKMFWKNYSKIEHTPVVFSVGNNIYDHPSGEVVNFYIRNDYEIYSTNKVGCLNSITMNKQNKITSSLLNATSTLVLPSIKSNYDGDQTFELLGNVFQKI